MLKLNSACLVVVGDRRKGNGEKIEWGLRDISKHFKRRA
jgi:hypothetical protein